MALEDALEALSERRAAFREFRASVEEELRNKRQEMLAAEQSSIEHLIVQAMAQGATLGQVKRAYGTKDHRTIATIVYARKGEIEAVRKARQKERIAEEWFDIDERTKTVRVILDTHVAVFEWSIVDGKYYFITSTPRWDDTYTIENKAVVALDGKTEDEAEEAGVIAEALRELEGSQ